MPKRTARVESRTPRAMPSRPRIAFIATSGCAAMLWSSRAAASISGSGEAVACANAVGTVAPTAVCGTKIAKRFMSHSRHTPVTGTVPDYSLRGLICVIATNSLQIVAGEAQRQVNHSRTVDSACMDAIVLPGDHSLGGGSCLIRGAKKIQSAIRRGAVSGRRLSGARLLLLASRVL